MSGVLSTLGYIMIAAACIEYFTRGSLGIRLSHSMTVNQSAIAILIVGIVLILAGRSQVRD